MTRWPCRLVASDVLDCADRLRATGELPVHPTFFEATTAMAFELFRRADVEVAVIEVGLGGRYDSTNVISPQIGAITSIGFDHQQFLGNTIEAIAFEKAGIIKPGMDVVTGALPVEARDVIDRGRGQTWGAGWWTPARSSRVSIAEGHDDRLFIETPEDRYGPLTARRCEVHTRSAMPWWRSGCSKRRDAGALAYRKSRSSAE